VKKVALRGGGIVLAGGLAALAALASCSAVTTSDAARAFDGGVNDGGATGDANSPFGDAGATPFVEANAIVLVHAAGFPAFRVCFAGAPNDLPQPSVDVMPESNVVGVDVGTAVRLPPRHEKLGQAFVFPESVLRPLYPAYGGSGPTCDQVLNAQGTKPYAIDVGSVDRDLSRGVHALVLGGCQRKSIDANATTDRCGADWTAASGNLKLTTLTLTAYSRLGDARLPVQIVQLSPALQRRAQGRALGIAFGALGGGAAPAPFVEGAVPFGEAVPNPPAALDYSTTDVAAFATSGVFVTLGAALDDAGVPVDAGAGAAREIVIRQSLADIQKRSSPRSLPADWFSVASSYVVLSVGDTNPLLPDGGKDDDPRRALHLLAIPLATPDAGAATDDAGR
jgi:hypothetical protein